MGPSSGSNISLNKVCLRIFKTGHRLKPASKMLNKSKGTSAFGSTKICPSYYMECLGVKLNSMEKNKKGNISWHIVLLYTCKITQIPVFG
jgi:hypothetical protein